MKETGYRRDAALEYAKKWAMGRNPRRLHEFRLTVHLRGERGHEL